MSGVSAYLPCYLEIRGQLNAAPLQTCEMVAHLGVIVGDGYENAPVGMAHAFERHIGRKVRQR